LKGLNVEQAVLWSS